MSADCAPVVRLTAAIVNASADIQKPARTVLRAFIAASTRADRRSERPGRTGNASGALQRPHRPAEVLPGSYGVINNDRREPSADRVRIAAGVGRERLREPHLRLVL